MHQKHVGPYSTCTGKKTPGEPGHTRDTRDTRAQVKRHRGEPGITRDTRAHAGKRITRTNLTTIHPNPTTHPHENRDRLNSRKNSRKPGVDRSPRPTTTRSNDAFCVESFWEIRFRPAMYTP